MTNEQNSEKPCGYKTNIQGETYCLNKEQCKSMDRAHTTSIYDLSNSNGQGFKKLYIPRCNQAAVQTATAVRV